jgi:anti-anti-sigma factor
VSFALAQLSPPTGRCSGAVRYRQPIAAQIGRRWDARRILRASFACLTGFISTKVVTYVNDSDFEDQCGGCSFVLQRLPGNVTIVRATGDLDGDTYALMYRLVVDELVREPAQLMLELSGVTSFDDAGVESLLGVSALAGESDTSFCLVALPSSPVVRALAAADLTERFEIFTTVGEAQRHR